MKPTLRDGKGLPGVGGMKCPCCKTKMSHQKNRRIIRHRERALLDREVQKEIEDTE